MNIVDIIVKAKRHLIGKSVKYYICEINGETSTGCLIGEYNFIFVHKDGMGLASYNPILKVFLLDVVLTLEEYLALEYFLKLDICTNKDYHCMVCVFLRNEYYKKLKV